MWTSVTIYSVTVCLGSCSLSVQFLQSSVTMFTITRHHPFHLTTFMVSVTDLETLTYPGPHAMHQHELNKWYEFKSNEAIWGYGQFFSVSISSKVSSLEPRSPVWQSIHLSSSAIWMAIKVNVNMSHYILCHNDDDYLALHNCQDHHDHCAD